MVRTGWYGNSHGHSLAARGIRLYAKKESMQPLFFAQERERMVPFLDLVDGIKAREDYHSLCRKYPDADKEDLRIRGIKASEVVSGDNTLSAINRNGVDESVKMAKMNAEQKRKMQEVLDDRQKSSFLHPQKVEFLKQRLRTEA